MTSVKSPEWVNRELFTALLKQNYGEFEGIQMFECKSAISGGENYLTIVLRIGIEMLMKGKRHGREFHCMCVCMLEETQFKFTEPFINR